MFRESDQRAFELECPHCDWKDTVLAQGLPLPRLPALRWAPFRKRTIFDALADMLLKLPTRCPKCGGPLNKRELCVR